jgi:tetratricopeptide (TPR) repeat protein
MNHRKPLSPLKAAICVLATLVLAVALRQVLDRRVQQMQTPSRRQFQLAETHYANGRIEEALDAWQEAISFEPTWNEPYLRQSEALLGLGEVQASILVLQAALHVDPKMPHVVCRMAQTYLEAEDPIGAGEWASTALKNEPDCALAHVVYARTHQADVGEMISHFQRARQLAPADLTIPVRLAKIQAESGELREAEQTIRSMGEGALKDADTRFVLGMALARRSRDAATRREAEQHLKEVVRLAPDRHDAHAELGMLSERHREWNQAREHFEHARRLNPYSPAVLHHLATVYRQLNDPRVATLRDDLSDLQARTRKWRELRQALAKRPDDLKLALDTAEAALSLGAEVSARNIVRAVVRQEPKNDRARRLAARLEQ